jgi:hypothetical protein
LRLRALESAEHSERREKLAVGEGLAAFSDTEDTETQRTQRVWEMDLLDPGRTADSENPPLWSP